MKKVLWISRHDPLPSQIRALEARFGRGTQVYQDAKPFDSAEEILARFKRGKFHEMVVVAPLSVLARLCELGVKPLWAEMERVDNPEDAEVEAAGRLYRFVRFRRILGIEIRYGDV